VKDGAEALAPRARLLEDERCGRRADPAHLAPQDLDVRLPLPPPRLDDRVELRGKEREGINALASRTRGVHRSPLQPGRARACAPERGDDAAFFEENEVASVRGELDDERRASGDVERERTIGRELIDPHDAPARERASGDSHEGVGAPSRAFPSPEGTADPGGSQGRRRRRARSPSSHGRNGGGSATPIPVAAPRGSLRPRPIPAPARPRRGRGCPRLSGDA
jgi:hypothetical protein